MLYLSLSRNYRCNIRRVGRATPLHTNIIAITPSVVWAIVMHLGDVVIALNKIIMSRTWRKLYPLIKLTNEIPAILFDMVEIDSVPGIRIAVAGGIDTSSAELLSFLICEIPSVALVQDTIREGATRPDGEQVALQTRAIRVNIENDWTL